jgi:hypothetical protein
MNVEIGAEAAQFPEKEYINGIAFAVYSTWSTVARLLIVYGLWLISYWLRFLVNGSWLLIYG